MLYLLLCPVISPSCPLALPLQAFTQAFAGIIHIGNTKTAS